MKGLILEWHGLLKMPQEEIENLNRPASYDIELVMEKLPTKKIPDPDGFTC